MKFFTGKKTLEDFVDSKWIDNIPCLCGLPLYNRKAFFQTFPNYTFDFEIKPVSKEQTGGKIDENTRNINAIKVPPKVKEFIKDLKGYSVIGLRDEYHAIPHNFWFGNHCGHDNEKNTKISYMVVKDRRPVLVIPRHDQLELPEYFQWKELQIDRYNFEGSLPAALVVETVEDIESAKDAHFFNVAEIRANDWYKFYKEESKLEVFVLSLKGGNG